jgi:peptidoglycan/LPS O-acetylase OafA/YrhL
LPASKAPTSPQNGQPNLPALTSIRFFLALWVVIYHQIPHQSNELAISWLPGAPDAINAFLRCGYGAVSAFFVLSGFVLGYNYRFDSVWESHRRLRFWAGRFSRIYPAYLAALLLLLPFYAYAWLTKGFMPSVGSQLGSALANVLLLQAWWPDWALSWNYPGWSLSNEAFFYLLFPSIGAALIPVRSPAQLIKTGIWVWLLGLTVAILGTRLPSCGMAGVLATQTALPGTDFFCPNLLRYLPLFRLPEFVIGILAAKFYRVNPPGSNAPWLALMGAAGACIVLTQSHHVPYLMVHNGILTPFFALLVLGLADLQKGWLYGLMSNRVLLFLGKASYSMYILQVPVQWWLWPILENVTSLQPFTSVGTIVQTLVTVLASAIFYVAFEETMHGQLREFLLNWMARRRAET